MEEKLITPKKPVRRIQTNGEEIANTVSHGVLSLLGLTALILLILKDDDSSSLIGAIIYGTSLFLLGLISSLYHALAKTKALGVMRRFDHISIFFLIGGTYAPVLLMVPALKTPLFGIDGALASGLVFLIIQWSLILIGIIFKVFFINRFKHLHYIIYLLLGWGALLFIKDLYLYSQMAFWLILAGGATYSLGVIFYTKSSKYRYFHFIWHLFVAGAALLQFLGIYLYIF